MNNFQKQAAFEQYCHQVMGEFIGNLWQKLKLKWRMWRLKRRGFGESPLVHPIEIQAVLNEFHTMQMEHLRRYQYDPDEGLRITPLARQQVFKTTPPPDDIWPEYIEEKDD